VISLEVEPHRSCKRHNYRLQERDCLNFRKILRDAPLVALDMGFAEHLRLKEAVALARTAGLELGANGPSFDAMLHRDFGLPHRYPTQRDQVLPVSLIPVVLAVSVTTSVDAVSAGQSP